eukprot:2630686-Rhodomonas_salina.1
MLDMGPDYCTIDGNRYATTFLIKHTRFLLVFLHKDKTGKQVVNMMRMARAKIGSWPAEMMSDGDPAYDSPEVKELFLAEHIDH